MDWIAEVEIDEGWICTTCVCVGTGDACISAAIVCVGSGSAADVCAGAGED